MSVQSKVVRYGTLTGRAITAITGLLTALLVVRFLLDKNPETLAHVLMVVPLLVVCLVGSWAHGKLSG